MWNWLKSALGAGSQSQEQAATATPLEEPAFAPWDGDAPEPIPLADQVCATCGAQVTLHRPPRVQTFRADSDPAFFCSVAHVEPYLVAHRHQPVGVYLEVLSADTGFRRFASDRLQWVRGAKAWVMLGAEDPKGGRHSGVCQRPGRHGLHGGWRGRAAHAVHGVPAQGVEGGVARREGGPGEPRDLDRRARPCSPWVGGVMLVLHILLGLGHAADPAPPPFQSGLAVEAVVVQASGSVHKGLAGLSAVPGPDGALALRTASADADVWAQPMLLMKDSQRGSFNLKGDDWWMNLEVTPTVKSGQIELLTALDLGTGKRRMHANPTMSAREGRWVVAQDKNTTLAMRVHHIDTPADLHALNEERARIEQRFEEQMQPLSKGARKKALLELLE